jgi:hypothetical protein
MAGGQPSLSAARQHEGREGGPRSAAPRHGPLAMGLPACKCSPRRPLLSPQVSCSAARARGDGAPSRAFTSLAAGSRMCPARRPRSSAPSEHGKPPASSRRPSPSVGRRTRLHLIASDCLCGKPPASSRRPSPSVGRRTRCSSRARAHALDLESTPACMCSPRRARALDLERTPACMCSPRRSHPLSPQVLAALRERECALDLQRTPGRHALASQRPTARRTPANRPT